MTFESQSGSDAFAQMGRRNATHAALSLLLQDSQRSFRYVKSGRRHAMFLYAWPMSADYASTEDMDTVNGTQLHVKNVV
jgi:hypothetical protein